MKPDVKIYQKDSPYRYPWPLRERVAMFLWDVVWTSLCSLTPKPLNLWRLFWLKVFGAKIYGRPFIHQSAFIKIPWKVILHDRACVGEKASLYSLDIIELKTKSTVAQEAYISTGTHDFSDPKLALVTAKITIGESAFIGARAFIMPGVNIGEGAVVGACSVVTKDVSPWTICVGNPCRPIKARTINNI